MFENIKNYKLMILVGIFSALGGALFSAQIINSQEKKVITLNLDAIFEQNIPECQNLEDKKIECKINKIKELLHKSNYKLVVKENCIIQPQNYQVIDRTEFFIKNILNKN